MRAIMSVFDLYGLNSPHSRSALSLSTMHMAIEVERNVLNCVDRHVGLLCLYAGKRCILQGPITWSPVAYVRIHVENHAVVILQSAEHTHMSQGLRGMCQMQAHGSVMLWLCKHSYLRTHTIPAVPGMSGS